MRIIKWLTKPRNYCVTNTDHEFMNGSNNCCRCGYWLRKGTK
jgi:hypothetical protein